MRPFRISGLKILCLILLIFAFLIWYKEPRNKLEINQNFKETNDKIFLDFEDKYKKDDYKEYIEDKIVNQVQNDGPKLGVNKNIIQETIIQPTFDEGVVGNFEPPKVEYTSEGPGEGGKPYAVSKKLSAKVSEGMSEYGMNIAASDLISLNRTIPDTRHIECQHWSYPTSLPEASVVIVFHNEALSVLLRTIQSVINRSPSSLLKEILLVDDFSDKFDLQKTLEFKIAKYSIIRLIRNSKRQGLIRSRNIGAKESSGVVIVFLDAHCEVNLNWLPPLLAPIYKNHKTMSVPIIDGIDYKSFEVQPVYQGDSIFRGIFEWGMLYKESAVPKSVAQSRDYDSEPYPSPTHAGGLFAINRAYFIELGLYDSGLLVWGGENFELSFKIWQCGGSIVWVPCSRVGHVYRGFMPYDFGDLTKGHKGPIITTNYKRVVEVWMDQKYKEYFYTREPLARFITIGDISKQLQLKKKLKCKSFEWFIKNVAIELSEEFPDLPPNTHWGKLKNSYSKQCVSTGGNTAPSLMELEPCFDDTSGTQLFRLNLEGQIGNGERCVEAGRRGLTLIHCESASVSGPWKYDEKSLQLTHSTSGGCLDVSSRNVPKVTICDSSKASQAWTFVKIQPDW